MTRTSSPPDKVTTLIFDVDDTLYDVSTGFTAHRNGEIVQQFMVEELNFPDLASAKKLRDEYFEKYHATAKALTVAEQEGRFPPPKEGEPVRSPRFQTPRLAQYWADNLDYSRLGGKKLQLAKDLAECPLKLVAFSNGPRIYVKQVLLALGLWDLFGEERLFAVDDVLPYCKPEEEAFRKIFEKVGCRAEECIMVEDSMKNVRRAKELGMKTVLITGNRSAQSESLRILPGDKPEINDLAVDIHMEVIEEFREKLGSLWEDPPVFRTS